ncbi:ShlB/FhaC/HecB family hemolysin secretion/activation protein [Ramlibacter sp. WS9]|uniref:ShlB/FhaC/HecB family hemolysin secretion/activation protein n=1 Tax=Ramlibacter sp. WS9 TaxID=1882741 RepID=UPI001144129F|nr:ShlB/FhaC/HecB family hemolysin secretion/activation protein [Ramlibacter sp. WS9]ROZ72180.1 ShlB/FhaC/HecB family hemolysin secretion/activation protein [Ramlibacter sp. WS9]
MVTGLSASRSRGQAALALLAVAASAMAAPAFAQVRGAIPMAAPAAPPVFAIRGFKITGDNPLGDGETTQVLAPFLRADATIDTLQKATSALETALRSKGFGLHRVALPPQEVGDTVTLNIVRFTVAKVTVEGRSLYDEGNVRRALPELREGESPNFKTLAIQSAIANENPNKQVQVGLRESEQPDKIDATITVKEQRPWTFAVGLSNAGNESSGRDRLTISGGHTNLFNLDHQFVGAYTTSIERMSDVKQLGLSYKVPLYRQGGVVGINYTRSDVVGNFGSFTSTGAGHTLGVNYTLYLTPEGGRRSYVAFGVDDKVFDAIEISGVAVGVDRRSRPLTLGYIARTESDGSVWGYDVNLAVNTGSGANNDLASYQSEEPRIDTVHWKAVRGGLHYTASFAQTWLWSARAQYQYSPDVLISGEQFGLGGLGSVRGTSIDRPMSGDKGVAGTFEVTTPEVMTGLRFLGFVDAGWLGNNSANGANKPSSDHLASVGLGLRFLKEPFAVSMDYGRLLNSSKVPLSLNSASPQRGDDRFYVNLSVRF